MPMRGVGRLKRERLVMSIEARRLELVLTTMAVALLCAGCGSSGSSGSTATTTAIHGRGVTSKTPITTTSTSRTTPTRSTTGGSNVTGTPKTLQGAQLCRDFTLAQAQTLNPAVEGPGKVASSAQSTTKAYETAECNYQNAADGSVVVAAISFAEPFEEAGWVKEAHSPAAGGQVVTTGIPELGEGAACVRSVGTGGSVYVYVARGTAQVKLEVIGTSALLPSCPIAIAKARALNAAIA
jgi:hypothetical protein